MKQSVIKSVRASMLRYKLPVAKLTFTSEPNNNLKVTRSEDAAKFMFDSWEQGTLEVNESFYVMMLARNNKVKGIIRHSFGGLAATIFDTKTAVAAALLSLSSSVIIAHNHPSGGIRPSEQDKKVTHQAVQAFKAVDIQVLDHLILTPERELFFSFADENILY
jgi:DNA repair protein RadC